MRPYPGELEPTRTALMSHIPEPRAAADALDHAPAANAAAEAARERSEQIRLHRETTRTEHAPVVVTSETDAVLRGWLCAEPPR